MLSDLPEAHGQGAGARDVGGGRAVGLRACRDAARPDRGVPWGDAGRGRQKRSTTPSGTGPEEAEVRGIPVILYAPDHELEFGCMTFNLPQVCSLLLERSVSLQG